MARRAYFNTIIYRYQVSEPSDNCAFIVSLRSHLQVRPAGHGTGLHFAALIARILVAQTHRVKRYKPAP